MIDIMNGCLDDQEWIERKIIEEIGKKKHEEIKQVIDIICSIKEITNIKIEVQEQK